MRLAVQCMQNERRARHPAIRSRYLLCSGIAVFRAFLPAVTEIKTGGFSVSCSTALLINGGTSRSTASDYVSCPGLQEYLSSTRSLFFSCDSNVSNLFLFLSFLGIHTAVSWKALLTTAKAALRIQPLVRDPPCFLVRLVLLKTGSMLHVSF